MLIIPVIDLSCGLVVHAKQGQRESYQPIVSLISESPEPEIVLSSFLELYPFKIIYIADLDAIQNNGNNFHLIENLAKNNPCCEFWVDAGVTLINSNPLQTNIKLIFGSENKLSEQDLSNLITNNPDIILSLDFSKTGLLENTYLLTQPSLWPKKVIVMMLHKVGSNTGVDTELLDSIQTMSIHSDIYSAGGVKDKQDLFTLNEKGVKGVLLASALHNGSITKENLEEFYHQ